MKVNKKYIGLAVLLSSVVLPGVSMASVTFSGPDVKFYGTTADDIMVVRPHNSCVGAEYQFKLNGVNLGCYEVIRNLTMDGMPGDDKLLVRDGVFIPGNLHMIGGLDNDTLRTGQYVAPDDDMGSDETSEVVLTVTTLDYYHSCSTELYLPVDVVPEGGSNYCVGIGGNLTMSAGPQDNLMTTDYTYVAGTADFFDGNHAGIVRMRNSGVDGTTDIAMAKGDDIVTITYGNYYEKVAIGANAGADYVRVDDTYFYGDVVHRDGSGDDKSVYCDSGIYGYESSASFDWRGNGGDDVLVIGSDSNVWNTAASVSISSGFLGVANGNSGQDKIKGDFYGLTLASIETQNTQSPECDSLVPVLVD